MNIHADNIIPFPGQPQRGALILRVDLALMPFPIWRRLRLDEQATFWDLHVAIQDAMGWSHRHRHQFTADHPASGERLRLGIPEGGGFHGSKAVMPCWELRVADVARLDHPPFLYTYHLGEEWLHEVILEGVESADEAGPTPSCLDGQGACPPEGAGGPDAFRGDPSDWPSGFGPDAFSADQVEFCDPGQIWRDYFEDE